MSLGEAIGQNYRRVGQPTALGEVNVSYDDVLPLHDIAAGQFFDVASKHATHEVDLDFNSSSMSGAIMLRSFGRADEEEPNRSLAVKVTHESEPDRWRLLARVATFGSGLLRGNKLVMYRIETAGEDVFEATKVAAFVSIKTEIVIEENEPRIRKISQRLLYEKLMDPGDCTRLASVLERGVRRAPHKFPIL